MTRCSAAALTLFLLMSSTVFADTVSLTGNELNEARKNRELGYEAQMKGDLARARFHYEIALADLPEDPGIYNDMGLVYEGLGQTDKAEESYQKALAIDPRFLAAHSNLGFFYKAKGQLRLAHDYFEKRVRYGRADDPMTLQAQVELDAILASTPELRRKAGMREKLALENAAALNVREKDAALRDTQRAFSESRAKIINAEVEYERGLALFETRQYGLAKEAFTRALGENMTHSGARHMLERVQGILERAPAIEAPTVNLNDPVAIAAREYNQGLGLEREGKRAEALQSFDRALLFSPLDPEILAARSRVAGP